MTTDPLDIDRLIAAGGEQEWDGMPGGTRMGHVHLHVGSLEHAEAFYHRALGLDKTVWSYPGALFLSAGGYHHHLGINIWSPGPAPTANEARLLEWELVVPTVDDFGAVARSLDAAGYSIERTSDRVVAADPWGTQVRIRAES
jgi:catechol 2,3-dioxygenase